MKIFLILFFFVLFDSCRPKEDQIPYYSIEQDTKEYLVFPVGSYWIYEDENNSGSYDSLYLYRVESDIVDNRRVASYSYQRIDLYYYSSLNDDTLLRSIDKHIDAYLDVAGEVNLSNLNGDYVFFNRNKCVDSINLSSTNFLKKDCSDSLYTILGIQYKNCINFFETQSSTLNIYSKNVGIISRIDVNGRIWNLKRYFINN